MTDSQWGATFHCVGQRTFLWYDHECNMAQYCKSPYKNTIRGTTLFNNSTGYTHAYELNYFWKCKFWYGSGFCFCFFKSHVTRSNPQLQTKRGDCYFFSIPVVCAQSSPLPLLQLSSPLEKLHQGLKHMGWNASKELLWTKRALEKEEGKNKSMTWKQWMGHKGIKWPRVHQKLISYSTQSRRAESNLR